MILYGKIAEVWSDKYLVELYVNNNKIMRGYVDGKSIYEDDKQYLLSGTKIYFYNDTKKIKSVYNHLYVNKPKLLEYKQQSKNSQKTEN